MNKARAIAAAAPPRLIEYRKIVLVRGLQFVDSPLPRVAKRVPGMILDTSGDSALYFSRTQGVGFNIQVVRKKSEFKDALQTPNLHVIYDAHSRYGRGCCFGDTVDANGMSVPPNADNDAPLPLPGEDWETGATPETGLYRMGFGYVSIPLSDMLHHGYNYYPVPSSVPLNTADCHPDIIAGMKVMRPATLVDPEVTSVEEAALKAEKKTPPFRLELPGRARNLDGTQPNIGTDTFWFMKSLNSAEEHVQKQLVLYAGWKSTLAAPMDLDATDLKCRVFAHFGCSSSLHFRPIVRDQKSWQQSGNEGYAFFTSSASLPHYTSTAWLVALLTYNKYNAGMSWKPSLDYAVQRANGELAGLSMTYHVI